MGEPRVDEKAGVKTPPGTELRIPFDKGTTEAIAAAASASNRTFNDEVLARLRTFVKQPDRA